MKKMQIGNLIQETREALDLSREQLAEELEVATTTIFRWEKGHQSIGFEYMVRLAKALDKPLSFFAGEKFEDTRPRVHPLKLSDFARKLSSIPDDVFEMVEDLGSSHQVWDFVRGAHDAAMKIKKEKDKAKGKPA